MAARRWRSAGEVAAARQRLPPTGAHAVSKLQIVDRLVAAGRWRAAKTALTADDLAHDRWNAAVEIYSNDPQVRGLLTSIGADPDAILAP